MANIVIIGGGVSGIAMSYIARKNFPGKEICIFSKQEPVPDIVFHLHRQIPDLPELTGRDVIKFRSSVYGEDGIKLLPTIKDINQYSHKVFDKLFITNCGNSPEFTIVPVGIREITQHLNQKITYQEVKAIIPEEKVVLTKDGATKYDYLISTIPLPILLNLLSIKHSIKFNHYPFFTTRMKVNPTKMFQQLYVSHKDLNSTRITLMDDEMYFESMADYLKSDDYGMIKSVWGIDCGGLEFIEVKPGRIGILSKEVRKPIIHGLTEKYDIMVLGRYGSWSYKIFNDVWEDAKFLCKIIKDKETSRSWIL